MNIYCYSLTKAGVEDAPVIGQASVSSGKAQQGGPNHQKLDQDEQAQAVGDEQWQHHAC